MNYLNTFNQNIPDNVHDTSISSNNVPNSEVSPSDSSYFLKVNEDEDINSETILPEEHEFTPDLLMNQNLYNVEKDSDFLSNLSNLRLKNVNRIIFAHININSIRNKFHLLTGNISGKIDILMISETKLDNSFPKREFIIPGFTEPYRIDRNCHGGGILLYIRSDIPSKEIPNSRLLSPSEGFFVEINLRKRKWLISCSYIPNKSLIQNHLLEISNKLDSCSSRYEKLFLMGDFNSEPHDLHMEDFCLNYNLSNLIKEPTCFKNPENPSCIDLMLTNFPKGFQNSMAIETGLSDFHKMIVTVMKSHYKKQKPKIICYRKYTNYSTDLFREELLNNISKENFQNMTLNAFKTIFMVLLDKFARMKHKYIRANQAPFMNKTLNKSVMNRSRLKNRYLKNRTPENWLAYKKQRNSCVSLFRKEKKAFYYHLDTKSVTDNKMFWKVIKPSFSDKAISNENITLVENNEIVSEVKKICEIFNDFFSNAVINLNIPETEYSSTIIAGTNEIVSIAIERYEHHPSIAKINNISTTDQTFSFQHVSREEIQKEIANLNPTKASQDNDIPTRIIKENSDILCEFIYNVLIIT